MDTTSPKKTKPNLYLDVDGVFFGLYGIGDEEACYQLRPYAHSFARWVYERFNCKWLTCWSETQLLGETYEHAPTPAKWATDVLVTRKYIAGFMVLGYIGVATEMEYVHWRRGEPRWQPRHDEHPDKIDAIDVPNEDFYWLEDGIGPEAEQVLRNHGKLDRYLYVDERGEDGLLIAKRWLEQKLRERDEQVRTTEKESG